MMKIIVNVFIVLFFCTASGRSALDSQPRVLINRNEVNRIITAIQTYPRAQEDFERFLNNHSYIESVIPFHADLTTLHRLVNKVMKNAFFYMMATNAPQLPARDGYEGHPQKYMRNIENDLLNLVHPDSIKSIQSLSGLQGAGYAVKALAVAYDWGYDYFDEKAAVSRNDLEKALRMWAEWYTSANRYYGSVFENHAPWGAKSLAYIAAALGEEQLFYGRDTKIQASTVPGDDTRALKAEVNISAKGFFDQVLHAANFVAYPRGGWHESVSYFLVKEIPELLEYAELVCTYHDDELYTTSVYASPLFKNAGLFLYHMTTPDGMLQKIADTGSKTALPSEFYIPGGNTYGDINNPGAGYLGGYFLRRLQNRLMSVGAVKEAEFIKFYADEVCFDFNAIKPKAENHINLLYALLWTDYSGSTGLSQRQLLDNPLHSNAIYFDNTGILISKNPGDKYSDTVVRFDAQPYFFGNHQHFAAGNFTLFKGANLAIDGGRYISPQNEQALRVTEEQYRAPLAHNVVLIGDDLVGQKSFKKQPNRAPYTIRQLDPFQEYSAGPHNVSTFLSEQHKENWRCPWQLSGMNVNLTSLYDHVDVEHYSRTLLHFFQPGGTDVILTFDDLTLHSAQTAHWQMHVRDNGQNTFYGDSIYIVQRNERINPRLVKSGFGDKYEGQLLVTSLSPTLSSSIQDFSFADSICDNCWNGRVWEESTHILRFTSPPQNQHGILMALLPSHQSSEKTSNDAPFVDELDNQNSFFSTIEISSDNINDDEKTATYFNPASIQNDAREHFQFRFKNLKNGWMVFYGVAAGEWNLFVKTQNDEIIQSNYRTTLNFYPRESRGVVIFPLEKIEGHDDIIMSLSRL